MKIGLILLFIILVQAEQTCDILIAGGTLASMAAIIQSPSSLKVCAV